tara:strand:- start:439 stop:858 length:420 start_codon:yes stop_codon:yes gene_type:complete
MKLTSFESGKPAYYRTASPSCEVQRVRSLYYSAAVSTGQTQPQRPLAESEAGLIVQPIHCWTKIAPECVEFLFVLGEEIHSWSKGRGAYTESSQIFQIEEEMLPLESSELDYETLPAGPDPNDIQVEEVLEAWGRSSAD